MEQTLPAIADLIPHRGTMLLLDRVLMVGAESCLAEYTPSSQAWYADDRGNMPAWIGIELMAQTVAAYAGASMRGKGVAPRQGVLLGTRSYKANQPFFLADQCLRIRAIVGYRDESGLGAFECRIENGAAETLANATLKVFEPVDFQAFLKGNLE